MWNIFGVFLKVAMIVLATIMLTALTDVRLSEKKQINLSDLPDFNYLPQIHRLIHLNCFGEAAELCETVIQEHLPGAEEAKALKRLCDQEVTAAAARLRRGVKGFVTGSSDSLEEAGGAVLSDLIIYGDIRDLVMQGWFKVSGQETDLFITVFAAAGLTTELIQWADWMPAMLKLLRKCGAMTEPFAEITGKMLKNTVKTGKASPETIQLFSNLSTLFRKNSFPRSARILHYVHSPGELALYVKLTERGSNVPYLLLISGGKRGADVMKRFGSAGNGGIRMLTEAARKGPPGVAFLKKYTPVKTVKWGARIAKTIHTERFHDFIYHTAKTFAPAYWGFWIVVAMMYLYGASGIYDLWRVIRWIFPKREENQKPAYNDK